MTTRQHLIEQDCMDKLGWDINRVAVTSEDEMVRALCDYEKSNTFVHDTPKKLPTNSDTHMTSDIDMVRTIRNHIRQKTDFLSSGQCMPDDAEILKSSIVEDQENIENMVTRLKSQLDSKLTEQNKRLKLYTLLRKLSINKTSKQDVKHMKSLEKVLDVLSGDIDELKTIIMD